MNWLYENMQTLDIDLNHPDFTSDPYPTYRRMRESGEPYWMPNPAQNSQLPGMWLFTRYTDVAQIFKPSCPISKKLSWVRAPKNMSPMDTAMLNQDAPEHTRLRNLVNHAFAPARIRELDVRIEGIAEEMITAMAAKNGGDFVQDFAIPFPARVIAEFMGVPFEDYLRFCGWSGEILSGYDSGAKSADNYQGYRAALRELEDYFTQLIELRRKQPSDDLISMLIAAHDEHDRLSGGELLSMCMLLLVAGHETTTNLLSSGMLTLLRHPEQFELLKRQPQHLHSAIEEMLRFESPVQRGTFRITISSCEIAGKKFREGEQIIAVIGAANRDPEQFPEPERFDITRTPNRHLSLGAGIHACLGAHLARVEARIAFSKIIEHLPNLHLAGAPVWNDKQLFRGLKSLPLQCI